MTGKNMYWILFVFLGIGMFYPVVGFIAIICMIGPVLLAFGRGRYWCGHFCPRGNFYDQVIKRISPQKQIPAVLRTTAFRSFMVAFIFIVFGVQMYRAWGNLAAMGGVFMQIILLTTLVGILLGVIYHQRTWCSFCPMGTLSAWASPQQSNEKKIHFQTILVQDSCVQCGICAKFCPMQLRPFSGKSDPGGFVHQDCLKCGKCIEKCPKKVLAFNRTDQ